MAYRQLVDNLDDDTPQKPPKIPLETPQSSRRAIFDSRMSPSMDMLIKRMNRLGLKTPVHTPMRNKMDTASLDGSIFDDMEKSIADTNKNLKTIQKSLDSSFNASCGVSEQMSGTVNYINDDMIKEALERAHKRRRNVNLSCSQDLLENAFLQETHLSTESKSNKLDESFQEDDDLSPFHEIQNALQCLHVSNKSEDNDEGSILDQSLNNVSEVFLLLKFNRNLGKKQLVQNEELLHQSLDSSKDLLKNVIDENFSCLVNAKQKELIEQSFLECLYCEGDKDVDHQWDNYEHSWHAVSDKNPQKFKTEMRKKNKSDPTINKTEYFTSSNCTNVHYKSQCLNNSVDFENKEKSPNKRTPMRHADHSQENAELSSLIVETNDSQKIIDLTNLTDQSFFATSLIEENDLILNTTIDLDESIIIMPICEDKDDNDKSIKENNSTINLESTVYYEPNIAENNSDIFTDTECNISVINHGEVTQYYDAEETLNRTHNTTNILEKSTEPLQDSKNIVISSVSISSSSSSSLSVTKYSPISKMRIEKKLSLDPVPRPKGFCPKF